MPRSTMGRLAHLAPALDHLEEHLEALEQAERYHAAFPKELKDALDSRTTSDPHVALLTTWLFADTDLRSTRTTEVRDAIESVKTVIREEGEDGEGNGGHLVLSDEDLAIARMMLRVLETMGTRSRREVMRFIDAIESDDSGFLVLQHLPSRSGGRRGTKAAAVEARFGFDMSPETAAAMKLRSVKSTHVSTDD